MDWQALSETLSTREQERERLARENAYLAAELRERYDSKWVETTHQWADDDYVIVKDHEAQEGDPHHDGVASVGAPDPPGDEGGDGQRRLKGNDGQHAAPYPGKGRAGS